MYTKHARPNQRRNYSNNNFSGGGNRNRSSNRGPRKQYIDPAKFVKSAKPVNQVEVEPENLFADFDLDQAIKANIERKNFIKPSPIQDQTIKHALLGKDIIGIADTGTGKTAAFALPIIQKLITDRNASAIVIAPTRELAQQIEVEFHDFAIGLNVRSAVLIGGQPMYKQIRQLSARPRLIIGTPGRIKDHIERRNINLANINILVLDEVDRMLDMGFLPDISEILAGLPKQRQSFFFSATIDRKIDGLINGFLIDPVRVSVKTGSTSDNVAQDVMQYSSDKDKIDKLHDTLIHDKTKKTLIFEETRRSVDRLSKELVIRGFKADIIHGGKTQGQRQRALRKFKMNETDILVATDVAARGIDIADISHVINYSLPQSYDDYIHRIGRAGRAGQTGQALTFVKK
ncbi:MAG TPA: DEAD/DEAH box helicase [Candidatus Saccharibacteria bacterium]|nr:DEAD/DEAH box helicase [Candidatus Saccharibacteria bacterium]